MFRDSTFDEVNRAGAADDTATGIAMNEETFRGFYERTSRGLWAYLARLTGDSELADDLLQETYYRFLRAAGTHESESHRRNSLYRIGLNLARDAHRRRRIHNPVSMERGGDELACGRERAGTADRVMDVNRAMSQLNQRERSLLWLAYAEGASHEEIARTMGLRTSSLKPMLFRARRRLAALLGLAAGGSK